MEAVNPAVASILEVTDEEDLHRAEDGERERPRTFRQVPHQPINAATNARISSGCTTKEPSSL